MLYAVLADDLTGAADAGIEFAEAGWRTRALRQAWQAADLRGAEVVMIDTGSRAFAPAVAYAAVRQAAAQLAQAGVTISYKKIDSTLRGPLGAELDAVLDACGLALAIVCPAFPAAGRTLREGVLTVHDVPVAQSAAGRDPVTPVRESHLPTLLASQTRRPVLHWPRLSPAQAAPATDGSDILPTLPPAGVLVVDALNEDDLARIAQVALAAPQPLLLAGSAGLAHPLAAQMARRVGRADCATSQPGSAANAAGATGEQMARPTEDTPREAAAPILVVCGSLHPVARAQARAVQEQCGSAAALLTTPETIAETPAAGGNPQQAAQTLAQTALAFLQTHTCAGIVATGGDTLESLLAALGAQGVDLKRALAPGVPLGRIAGGPWAGLRIVSKAGGFGELDTLVQAVRWLRGA